MKFNLRLVFALQLVFLAMALPAKPIVICEFDPGWAGQFVRLREVYWKLLGDKLIAVEHVGSTAVEGLCAKPVIDIDLVIPDLDVLSAIIPVVKRLGYTYLGEVAIPERFVFRPEGNLVPDTGEGIFWPKHHLYACLVGSNALANHLLLRDSLREDPVLMEAYGALKKRLASQCVNMEEYVMGKTGFICDVLRKKGMGEQELLAIAKQNENVIPTANH